MTYRCCFFYNIAMTFSSLNNNNFYIDMSLIIVVKLVSLGIKFAKYITYKKYIFIFTIDINIYSAQNPHTHTNA